MERGEKKTKKLLPEDKEGNRETEEENFAAMRAVSSAGHQWVQGWVGDGQFPWPPPQGLCLQDPHPQP